jgi:hypothetical protein
MTLPLGIAHHWGDATGGALPLMEFTLTRLWQTQRHKTLTLVGYHEMGGVRGALDQFAEEQARKLTDTPARLLDQVLLKLVRFSAGDASLATRQPVLNKDVSAAEWKVIQDLSKARLTINDKSPTGEPYAELVHESLIMAWRRLRSLVNDNADFLKWLARVQQRAEDADPLPEAGIEEARRWRRCSKPFPSYSSGVPFV